MSVTTVRLQPENETGLEAMADKLHRSKNWLINEAVRDYLSKQELDQQRWSETLQAMESAAQGKLVSGHSVHAWLESWGSVEELPPPPVGK